MKNKTKKLKKVNSKKSIHFFFIFIFLFGHHLKPTFVIKQQHNTAQHLNNTQLFYIILFIHTKLIYLYSLQTYNVQSDLVFRFS